MRAADTSPDPLKDAADADARERALLDLQLAELGRLAAMGMALAETIHRRVKAADDATSVADLQHAAIDFSRVARAVRLTFALQSKLIADFKAPAKAAKDAPEAKVPFDTMDVMWLGGREVNEPVRRSRVVTSIVDSARSVGLDREAVDRLGAEARERLEREVFGDIMIRPLQEIMDAIHRDLGLKPKWDPRSQALWAEEEVGPRAETAPLAREMSKRSCASGLDDPEEPEGESGATDGEDSAPLWSP